MSDALQRAANEGRNVLPDATDDQAAVIEKWARTVVREYDKTHLTHDVSYEDVAEAIDWLRIALDPKHPMYASLVPGGSPGGSPTHD